MIQIKKVGLTQLSLKSRGNKHQPVTLSRTMLINAINTSYGSLKTDPICSLSTSAQFCEIFSPLPYRASNISRFNNKKTKQGFPCILSSKSKHSLLEGKERARRFMKHEKLVGAEQPAVWKVLPEDYMNANNCWREETLQSAELQGSCTRELYGIWLSCVTTMLRWTLLLQ